MTVNLIKGLNTLISASAQDSLTVHLTWNAPQSYELDASAFMLNSSGKVPNDRAMIFFNQRQSPDNAVQYDAVRQCFSVDLKKIHPSIEKIAFTLTIDEAGITKQHVLQHLNQAVISVAKDGQALARYELITKELDQENALVFAELYLHKGQWKFKAIGQGFNHGLTELCGHFGVDVSEDNSQKTETINTNSRHSQTSSNPIQGMSFKKKLLIAGGLFIGILVLWLVFFLHGIYKKISHVSDIVQVAELVVKEANKDPQKWIDGSFGTPPTAINQAGSYPTPLENYINDFVQVLTPSDAASLRQQLKNLEQQTGIEGTIVTVNSIADYQTGDNSIESFATHLFNYWGVGNLPENNGFMVLVAIKDHKCRIELGKDYGDQHNKQAKAIIDQQVIPLFKEENYSAGIYRGTTAVIEMLTTTAEKPNWFNSLPIHKSKKISTLETVFLSGTIITLVIFAVWKNRRRITKTHCGIAALLGLSLWYFFNYMIIVLIIAIIIGLIYSRFNNDGEFSFNSRHNNDSGSSDSSDSFGGGDSSGDGVSGDW